MSETVIQQVLRRLKAIGIDDVFGVAGDYAFPVNDAIVEHRGINWIGCGLRPIVFVLNNSGYLSERMLCKDMALAYNDIAVWNYPELPHALGCQGWFTARASTCGELDDALKTAEQANSASYIEVVTDAYDAPPMYKKLHENVESFYNVH
jgi:TPP-dependent 2-oxoacid decarboxylase